MAFKSPERDVKPESSLRDIQGSNKNRHLLPIRQNKWNKMGTDFTTRSFVIFALEMIENDAFIRNRTGGEEARHFGGG